MSETSALRQRARGATFCIVPYCHPDFAWTHHREWHEERYAVSIAEALDLMRADPGFRFCVEPWIDQIEPFLSRCPDRVDELMERLATGQMGVKAFTLTSPRPATCSDETFVRNMVLGRRRYRAFAPEADLSVMACPDVGIGHSQMPQVVRLAGASLYRGWRSDAAFSEKGVPRDFVWVGLDGTRLITSRGIYGGLFTSELTGEDVREKWAEVVERLYAVELADAMDHSTLDLFWVALGHDDARPLRTIGSDRLMPISELIRLWNERGDSRMRFATPNEYGRLLAERTLPEWHGIIDPVDVAYNSGWHGERGLWRLRQQLDTAMIVAERACALASLAGADDVASPERLEELWVETVRLASHALQWVFERDWGWLLSRGRYLLREIGEACDHAVFRLAGVGRRSDEPRPLVLFNPLPYEREEIVEVPWVQPRTDAGGVRLVDAGGRDVPTQLGEPVGETFGGHIVEPPLVFRAQVPAMSCAVYRAIDAAAERAPAAAGPAISNGRLELVCFDRGLQSVRDLQTGLSWTAPRGGCIGDCRFFEMGEGPLHIGPITGEVGAPAGHGCLVLGGPLRFVFRWEGQVGPHRVRQDIVLDGGAGHFDLVTRVLCYGANGFFASCFDLPLAGDLHVDIPFGVEPRDLSGEPYGYELPPGHGNIERFRESQLWARSFASVSNGDVGISVITVDGDRYWTYEGNRLRHILFTPLRDEDATWEAWVTKDRMALGWHSFRHRVVLHAGDWRSADICGESDRARMPLRPVKPAAPQPASLAPGFGLALSPASVRLSAFYADAGGHVLRVHESAGSGTRSVAELPCTFAAARKVDLNLEPVEGAVLLEGRRLSLDLRPWEIATISLVR